MIFAIIYNTKKKSLKLKESLRPRRKADFCTRVLEGAIFSEAGTTKPTPRTKKRFHDFVQRRQVQKTVCDFYLPPDPRTWTRNTKGFVARYEPRKGGQPTFG